MYLPSPLLAFFDLSASELMLIMFVVLLFFGGDKLPGFARGLGKALRDFKKASSGVEEEIRRAMAEPPPKPNVIAPPAVPPVEPSVGAVPGEAEAAPSPPVETPLAASVEVQSNPATPTSVLGASPSEPAITPLPATPEKPHDQPAG